LNGARELHGLLGNIERFLKTVVLKGVQGNVAEVERLDEDLAF
jgi:hypothetical protein